MALQGERISQAWLLPLLKLRVWVSDHLRPTDMQITLLWAGVVGFLGALSSMAFRHLSDLAHWALTGYNAGLVESFSHLSPSMRLVIPAIGGALAGATLLIGTRLSRRKSSTDYMEAIVLGDGVVPARLSLVKCTSAMLSIASGASIGREGPMVQLSAMLASLVGRVRKTPTIQLRLLVACGAAAGIASAYNAPIGGALFISEIVLQSVAMETFGPLVFASVIATLTVQQFMGGNPLYEVDIPVVRLQSSAEMILFLALGLIAGLIAPWFLRLLRASETLFTKLGLPAYLRLALGGLVVGCLAVFHPEVCGNGYSTVGEILQGDWAWRGLAVVFVFKLIATSASFGSGAVGGVFTPTLFSGACLGYLFAAAAQLFWPGPPLVPGAFALVGMGAFLAATTHAPIMAIIMLFELTLDYPLILPLMLACVVAHYTCAAFEPKSIYTEGRKRKGAGSFQQQLAELRVADLMKKNPVRVLEQAGFAEIAETFVTHRFNYLYVVDESGRFKGVVSLHDIKAYLNEPELAEMVIAKDILREIFPATTPAHSLSDALIQFTSHEGERLPVVDSIEGRHLVGSISKCDLMLAVAERARQPVEQESPLFRATPEPE